MSQLLELRRAVIGLSAQERAELAAFLLGSLDEVHCWVDAEEVARRSEELDTGNVRGIFREEFNRASGH